MAENGNGNGRSLIPVIGVIVTILVGVITLLLLIQESMVKPVRQKLDADSARIDKVEQWQSDYSRGLIPSSAESEISSIKESLKEKFVTVEGQLGKSNATTNMGFESIWRVIQVMYKKIDGTDISIPNYWPEFGKKE